MRQEWCQKQMEFMLELGKPERTEAMKAGLDRHAQLDEEVRPHFSSPKQNAASSTRFYLEMRPIPSDSGIVPMENFSERISFRLGFILEQVFRSVGVAIRCAEESWALKFISFIVGTNQLMLEDITREVPV